MVTEAERSNLTEQQRRPKFDAVIALGKNWRLPISGEKDIYLSIEGKANTISGAQMVANGDAEFLVLSTGMTAGKDSNGKDYPPEANEMYRFMRRFFSEKEIPAEKVILQNTSFDTAGDAEEDKKIIERYGWKEVALVTVKPHTRRASRLFHNYGVQIAQVFASQDLLRNRSKHYDHFISKYYRSRKFIKELFVEALGTLLVYTIDPKGTRILRRLSSKTRGRDLDSYSERNTPIPVFVSSTT
jgi:uncharacterized SAM-binding protein YcdF (DUF218 family)